MRRIAEWNIGRKIAAGFLVILLQALAVGIYGLCMTRRSTAVLTVLSSAHLPEKAMAARIESELLNARIHFIYFVTIQKEGSLPQGWENFRAAQAELPKLRALVNGSAALADLRPDVERMNRDFENYIPMLERIIKVVQQHRNHGPEFDAMIREWARLGGAMVDSAGQLSLNGGNATDDLIGRAAAQLRYASLVLEIGCFVALLVGFLTAVILTRNTNRILREIIRNLGDTAQQVMQAAAQISESAQSLAEGASQQAASLEETSASTEEINSMASRNRENAVSAARNMGEASERINEANRHLEYMVVSMNEINASSDRISKIIKVIDEIAFQTNILALNAAVEAARAGEAGMGFAVVADEVRNLAQRCAQAARDTAGLIGESIAKSNDGRNKLDQVAAAVRSITESAAKVKMLVDQVESGSQEQSRGLGQIVQAITQIENVTQTTAAGAEENAAASEELKTQSGVLRTAVEQLDSMVGGSSR